MLIAEFKSDAEKAKQVVKKFERLKSERANWDTYWEQLAQFIIPRKDNVYGHPTVGEDKHNRLYDSTSIHSNELLASALHSMLTNPSSVWFGLSTGEKELDNIKEVRQWLQDAVMKIIKTLNNSNFQEEIHETYIDLGGIGTSVLDIMEDGQSVIRFKSRPIYEGYIEESSRGVVDTVYSEYEWTLRQIVQEFGKDALKASFELEREFETNPERKYCIIHAREPQSHKKDAKTASYHVLKEHAYLLKEAKFNEQPYAVPRWTKISGEKYGRCPGMKALPDIKMLNQMMRTAIRAAQKAADPPLMVPDNGFLLPIRTTPGGTNIYRAGTKDRIEPLIHNARLDINAEMIETTRIRVRQAFFIDQLQLQDGPQMTATEVMQRTEEQLRMMGPIIGRFNNELLKPIIDRVFGIMLRKQMFGPVPEALAKRELEVRYISQISKAQRASEADTFTRVVQSIAPIIEAQPQVFENFNGDEILRYHANIFGLPEEMLNSRDQVQQSRQAQQQAQAAQMQSEQENVDADTMQKLAKAQQ
jgi:hypothetical protein